MSDINTHFGHVAIIGRPNAGKSTLMNAILDTHLSIVSHKPQTTRRTVLGILTRDNCQFVLLDTAGLINPRYGLQRSMMSDVRGSLGEANLVLVIVDVVKACERGSIADPIIDRLLRDSQGAPAILVLNKMDALKDKKRAIPLIAEARDCGLYRQCIAVSARERKFLDDMLDVMREYLPVGPFVYDVDQLSNLPERFFVAELIREAIMARFEKEVPYATEVIIMEFTERDNGKWYIAADIVVERDTQKAILIGARGSALKWVGENARKSIELHLGHPIFLELYVKVRENWRNDRTQLASFGY